MRRDGYGYLVRATLRYRLGRVRSKWRARGHTPATVLAATDLDSGDLAAHHLLAPETPATLTALRVRPPNGSDTWGDAQPTPARDFMVLRDGQVFGGTGWVGVRGSVLAALGNALAGANCRTDPRLGSLTEGARLPGRSVSLTQQGFRNYFHWTMQGLPRLADVLAALGGPDAVDHFLHCEPGPAHMLESLVRLGVDPARLHRIGNDEIVTCEQLACATMLRDDETIPMEHIELVRNLYQDALAPAADDIVYISRARAQRRHVVNEAEVRAAVAEVGGRTVEAAAVSVAEQARLYSGIRLLVAVHGAELANIVFMPSTSTLLEIFPTTLFPPVYARLAHSRAMTYDCAVGIEPRLPWGSVALHAADVRVDIADLQRRLASHASR